CGSLPFTEREALARSRHAVLLPLLGAGIAREEPFGVERLTQFGVVLDERSCDAESHRARLSRRAAASDGGEDVELVSGLGQNQRLPNLHAKRLGREERFDGASVDANRAGAGAEEHAGGGCLAAAGAVILDCCHVTRPLV